MFKCEYCSRYQPEITMTTVNTDGGLRAPRDFADDVQRTAATGVWGG